MKNKVLIIALVTFFVLPEVATAFCDLSTQAYTYKSAFFYVTNAKTIRVTVLNSMGDPRPRCFATWIKIGGRYINLDGLPYSPDEWQRGYSATEWYNCNYKIALGNSGSAEYDLEKYAPNGYTGEVEVRVSSECYEDSCFCWNVKVEVVEYYKPTQYCYLNVYVEDQYKNPLSAYVYVDGSSTYGSYVFKEVLVGTHTISATKPGYISESKTITCYGGETKKVELVLTQIQACIPGEMKNRFCFSPTQIAYQKCKSDGSSFETIIENCASGYFCENGYCVFDKDGWYDTGRVRCNLFGFECGYGIKEKEEEYRDYICYYSSCTYTVKERRWVSIGSCYQGCPSGYTCDSGYCARTTCEEGYKEEYRCYGNWVQKKYVYSDCSSDWLNWGYCSYGCFDGKCLPKHKEPCKISLSVDNPGNSFVGNIIRTNVWIKNSGDEGCYVSLNTYVCKDSCHLMDCEDLSTDPRVYVQAQGTYVFSCRATVREEGNYRIKVSYSWLDKTENAFSGMFFVNKEEPKEELKCNAEFLNEFKCEGNWRLQLYRYSDCSVGWSYVNYCAYGCKNGNCLPKPEETESKEITEERIEEESLRTGLAFLAPSIDLLVLVFLLVVLFLFLMKRTNKTKKPEEFKF